MWFHFLTSIELCQPDDENQSLSSPKHRSRVQGTMYPFYIVKYTHNIMTYQMLKAESEKWLHFKPFYSTFFLEARYTSFKLTDAYMAFNVPAKSSVTSCTVTYTH